MKKPRPLILISAGAVLISAGLILAAGIDFSTPPAGHAVTPLQSGILWGPATTVKLFFPAQANLQWLAGVPGYNRTSGGPGSMAAHSGSSSVVSGAIDCKTCHNSALNAGTFASTLVTSTAGIPGKDAYKDVSIQAAYDESYLYLKAEWTSQRPRAGTSHNIYQRINGTWQYKSKNKVPGKSTVAELGTDELFSYEDRFAVMIAPKSVGDSIKAFGKSGMSFNQAGCFVSCHSSMRDMPLSPTAVSVQADAWLGSGGLNVSDLRHYLLHTRNVNAFGDADSMGNWKTSASAYGATKQKADFNNSKFIDLWMARMGRSAPMYCGSNDAVMDYRHSGTAGSNQGLNNWFDQGNPSSAVQPTNAAGVTYDNTTHTWKDGSGTAINVQNYIWMYDSAKTGFHGVPASALDATTGELKAEWSAKWPLITQGPERNAKLYDPTKVVNGMLLPRQVLRYSTGLRSALNVYSSWNATTKKYTVIFRRKLNTSAKCDHGSYGDFCSDLNITAADLRNNGQGITINFAVFDDHSTSRFHHVSFPFTLQDKTGADILAQYNGIVSVGEVSAPGGVGFESFPNPFTAGTQFRLTLPERCNVKFEVRDMTGKLVDTPLNRVMENGEHTVNWTPKDLGAGVYFCTLHAGTFHQTKKLMYTK